MLKQSHRLLLITLLCLLMMPLIQAQETENSESGVILTSDAVSEGYVLFSPMPSTIAYLIDNSGRIINQWESAYPMLAVYLLDNGDLLSSVAQVEHNFAAGGTGRIERYDWDNNLLWSYELDEADAQIHHDIEMLPNGNILMSMWELIAPDAFADWGLNPALVPEGGEPILFDRIIEIDPTNNTIVWEWRLLDHSVQDFDESLANYGIAAANPHLIDINYSHLGINVRDRSHFNGIDYNPDLNHILVSAHFQSEIWIIDHETGDLVYRWGNPLAYGRGLPTDRQLYNQHNPTWLDNGNIMIFNNGSANFRQFSTILEIEPPLNEDGSYALDDGSYYAPTAPVWEYRAEPPEAFFARNTSGAQALANGNIFVTEGPAGHLFEIDAEGNVVWAYLSPIFIQQEEEVNRAGIFRANRYLPNYGAFINRDLLASDEIAVEILD